MISRDSRNNLALALRQYASRIATNDDLDSVTVDRRDRGAVAIKDAAWFLYDDLYTHKATGRNTLDSEQKNGIARCVLFLHSDEEYVLV